MVIASSIWFLQYHFSYGWFCLKVAGLIWLFMVLYGVRCFWSVLDGS